jgi:hypothetical protein
MRRLLLVLALAACGPHDQVSDGGTSGPQRLECPFQFGTTFYWSTLEVMPPAQGFDLDDDGGGPDNELGALAGGINPAWRSSIMGGGLEFLIDLQSPTAPPLTDGGPVQAAIYFGRPSSGIGDAAFAATAAMGQGEFEIDQQQFQINCMGTSTLTGAIAGDTLVMQADPLAIFQLNAGLVLFRKVTALAKPTLSGDAITGIDIEMGLVLPACTASQIGAGMMTLAQAAALNGIQPDFDLDGDGLEKVFADARGITRCQLADNTMIVDPGCACSPKVQDGYSAALHIVGVPAKVTAISGRDGGVQ